MANLSPITITFADGSVLHADDLNVLKDAINAIVQDSNFKTTTIAAKANATDLAAVRNTANTANNLATVAINNAEEAGRLVQQANSTANAASATAAVAQEAVANLETTAMKVLPLSAIVNDVNVRTTPCPRTPDSIVYDRSRQTFLAVILDTSGPFPMNVYYTAWGGYGAYGEHADASNGVYPPLNGVIYQLTAGNGGIYVKSGSSLVEVQTNSL